LSAVGNYICLLSNFVYYVFLLAANANFYNSIATRPVEL